MTGLAKRGPGRLVAVVGPSGSGKDSIMRAARGLLAGNDEVVFPRRVITRATDPHEEHVPVSVEDFRALDVAGAFSLSWHAHGLRYGIRKEIDDAIDAGRTVVVNVSRAIIPLLRERYEHLTVVAVSVTPKYLAQRLAERGRETAEEIRARIDRAVQADITWPEAVELDNNGPLDEAARRFVSLVAPVT